MKETGTAATPSTELICDECGKRVPKITRVYHGHKYCLTCYAREFKRRLCPKCGNYTRLPRKDMAAVCRRCAVDKPCLRCGKTGFRVGRVTAAGPVCNSCAKYFREAEPCELCGNLSKRLTRVSRFQHNLRLCPKCACADYGNCPLCHHHRLLVVADDGSPMCKTCLEGGLIPCQECGQLMPAGRVSRCESCAWRSLLKKRVAMNRAAFAVPTMAEAFARYATWLVSKVGENKAAITINRYLLFFLEMEKVWKAIPDYSTLIGHFGAGRLRKVQLPMQWLQESGLVFKDAAMQVEDSEKRQILAGLQALKDYPKGWQILKGYHDMLMTKVEAGKLGLRSLRLALAPAKALLVEAQKSGLDIPHQKTVDWYLSNVPGQRAALSGFVRYLSKVHLVDIQLPVTRKGDLQTIRQRKLEKELLAMMRDGGSGEEFLRQWVAVGLAYFHGVVIPKKRIVLAGIIKDGDLFTVSTGGKEYTIPKWADSLLSPM